IRNNRLGPNPLQPCKPGENALKLVDLSRELSHKMPRLPNHPMVFIAPFTTHAEKRVADGYTFSTAVTSLNMGDHSGTHVDAPFHFDERPGAKTIDQLPLDDFFTAAVCFTHMEGPVNLDHLVGKGRFRFIGFPLKIKGGSGSPIQAVALLDDE